MDNQDIHSDTSDPYQTDEDSDYRPSDSEYDVTEGQVVQKSTRKRLRREENWAANKRKLKRASGLAYKNVKGQEIPGKVFKNAICHCNNKCTEKITADHCKQLFDNFYKLANFNMQSAYLFGQVKVIKKIRVYTDKENSRRDMTRIYYLPNDQGTDLKVCKEFFKQVLQISDGRLSRVLATKLDGIPPTDKRGKHPSARKTPDLKIQEVTNFIKQFPVFESHYSREKSGARKYLAPDLNIQIIFNLYKEHSESPVSIYVFRNIFNSHFNLHFHAPITDSCRRCDEFNNKLKVSNDEDKTRLEAQKELHLRKAEKARSEMKVDGEEASIKENETAAIAFDLMKTLPTPVLSTGITYYKRQLWTYCLGVHDLTNNSAVMYVWNESIASRGPQEIGSCLIHYCKNFVSSKKLIMYSDQCGGQNRNIKMALICDYIANSEQFSITEIDHKFLVSGHSYLPCDQDFGLIEKEKKYHKDVYVPDHWMTVIKSARKKNPFQIVKMTKNDFVSTKRLEDTITNRKMTLGGSKVEWMKIQWLKYTSETKHRFQFKYTNSKDIEFDTVNVEKRKRTPVEDTQLDLLYPIGRPIEKKKKDDLLQLLNYIPPVHHAFYTDLKTSATAIDELGDENVEANNELV